MSLIPGIRTGWSAPGCPVVAADRVAARQLVVVPARSEVGDQVASAVESVLAAVEADVLVLDGGMNDFSRLTRSQRVNWIEVPIGVGAAVRHGLAYAVAHDYDVVARIDVDGQHDPAVLRQMFQHQRAGVDLVLGSRYHPQSAVLGAPPPDRVALNIAFRSLVQQICRTRLTDVITGCWVMGPRAVSFLVPRLRVEGYGSTLEKVMLLGLSGEFSITEVPHPAIYAGSGLEARYAEDQLEHRCGRAGVYLNVVVDVVSRSGLDLWHLLVAGARGEYDRGPTYLSSAVSGARDRADG